METEKKTKGGGEGGNSGERSCAPLFPRQTRLGETRMIPGLTM